jgi:HEAT repeat protein
VRAAAHTAILLALAAAALGGEPPQVKRLTDMDRRQIYNHLDSCSSLELDLKQLEGHVRALVRIAAGRDEAADYIVSRGLSHAEAQTRMAAVEALGLIGSRRALVPLSELVEFDPNYTVRRHAVRALAGFGDDVALTRLFREIPDFDGSLRRRILSPPPGAGAETAAQRKARLEQLGETVSRALDRYEGLIRRMARNVDPDEKERATRELQRLTGDRNRVGDADWVNWWRERKGRPPPLHAGVNRTADRTTMMALIEMAALVRARSALRGMVTALRTGERPVRMAAAAAIGTLAAEADRDFREKAVTALREALGDTSGWVRAAAARALTACDPAGSAAHFETLLADRAPGDSSAGHREMLARVRRAAVAGLRAAKARGSAPRLAKLLIEPAGERLLEWDLVSALAELGSPSELPALATFTASAEPRARAHALAAVSTILKRESLRLPEGERRLPDLGEKRLFGLAASKDAAHAVAAVHELDRRGLLTARPEPFKGLTTSPAEARILATALLVVRRWTPAVRGLAEEARRDGSRSPAALAACRAVGEIGSDAANAAWKRSLPVGSQALQLEIAGRRRHAAEAMIRILEKDETPGELAARAAESLSLVLPSNESVLRVRSLAALVRAMGEARFKAARPEIGAALRRISGETYRDEPVPALHWWRAQEKRRGSRR